MIFSKSLFQCSLLAVLAVLMTAQVNAQGPDSPVAFAPLKTDVLIVKELAYDFKLPDTEVARIDDHILTQGDLLKQLLRTNLSSIATQLLQTKMIELEMEREVIEVSEEELQAELNELIARLSPGKTVDEVIAMGVYGRAYLLRSARMNRGWKELFWNAKNIAEDQRANQANQLLMQVYMNEVKSRYQLAIRGQKPSPPRGAVASLNTLVKGKRISYIVDTIEAMQFMIGVLKPAHIIKGRTDLVENYLINTRLERTQTAVTDTETEAWVRSMIEKYPPPFTWETILRLKGTSADEERQRWRTVQAWKRSGRVNITRDDLAAFREEHEDFFRSRHVKCSHVLIKFIDDVTGISKGPVAEEDALKRANLVHQKALEGVDFKRLAELYSNDDATAKGGGNLPQPIKKWGGGYDKDFQDAAYELEAGELSDPIRSSFGYHVILCTEVNPATTRQMDWESERYAEWILEEYETRHMQEWMKTLKKGRKISMLPTDDLIALKNIEFPKNK